MSLTIKQLSHIARAINVKMTILLAILVIAVYLNAVNNAFVSDDIATLQKNPAIRSFSNVIDNPLYFTSSLIYFITVKIGGINPLPFRISNILFHFGNVWLIYLLIIVGWFNPLLAFFTASIFAVHPVLTESVTWISGGPYIRYSFFFLASLMAYIKSQSNKKVYALSLALFILSLSSSDKAIVTFLLFLLYEFSLGNLRKNWKKLIPFFILSMIWILLYLSQIGGRITGVGVQSYIQTKFLNPFIQIPVAMTSYLQLLFWPDKLTLYHSEMSFSQVEYVIRLVITLGLLGMLGVLWRKSRLLFFWLMFFIISLLPTLTPFGISWIVAERYVYLGSIGIFFIMGYVLTSLIKNKKTETIACVIFIIGILALMTRTIIRNFDWKNEDTLWIATGKTSPSDPKTHNNLGDVYGRQGNLNRSAKEFQIAIQLNPRYADAYHNLGNTYRQMENTQKALENYFLAIKYNPNLWQSYQNIAAIYFEKEKYPEALKYMNEAIRVAPDKSLLYLNLGVIYLKQGDKINAKMAFETALRIDPTNQQAQRLLQLK